MKALNRSIKRFRKPETHKTIRKLDPETGEDVWFIDGNKVIPPERWAAVIGDILHNLHSMLDHLAWQLATRENGGVELPPHTRITFPIFKQKGKFWKEGDDGKKWSQRSGAATLERFPADSHELVLAVQPYQCRHRSPDHPLWLLHVLSNEDKHKTLHMVGSSHIDSRLEVVERKNVIVGEMTVYHGPLVGMTEIGRVKVIPTDEDDYYCKLQTHFRIAETFGERTPVVAGRYIGEVLDEIARYVRNDVFGRRFSPYFKT